MSDQNFQERLLSGAREIAAGLHAAGYEAWFVGGCVRDQLLGRPLKDIDITTDARPEQVAKIFGETRFVGKRFGVTLVRRNETDFEVAAFRSDGAYLNHRHPESVRYGTMEEDAARRDFTVNALYQHPESGAIRDFSSGRSDLKAGLIRAVGDPEQRFREDALRMLRAVRFAARLGFEIEDATWSAIKEFAPTIEFISAERHREELTRILTGPQPGRGLRLMDGCGLLHFLLPEIEAMKGVEQGKRHHPEGDVFQHTCLVMDQLEPRTPLNSWAALLHDVGKPPTFRRDAETGKISFIEHQNIGAEMARTILTRLKFSNREIDLISAVVKRHMTFMMVENMKESTLRKFLGAETIEHDLAVHRADCLGSVGSLIYYDFCAKKLQEYQNEQGSALPDPFLTGKDLISAGLKPGPQFKEILEQAAELQWDGVLKTREQALGWLKHHFGQE